MKRLAVTSGTDIEFLVFSEEDFEATIIDAPVEGFEFSNVASEITENEI